MTTKAISLDDALQIVEANGGYSQVVIVFDEGLAYIAPLTVAHFGQCQRISYHTADAITARASDHGHGMHTGRLNIEGLEYFTRFFNNA